MNWILSFITLVICNSEVFSANNQNSTFTSVNDGRLQNKTCTKNKFQCSKVKNCISKYDLCDGIEHCLDGSDETVELCSKLIGRCPHPNYQCTYGACVGNYTLCNEEVKCSAYSTVESCNICGRKRYACGSGMCVPSDVVCNGKADCDDGSDETIAICIANFCQGNQFKCTYGACIDETKKCDKINDCFDGSDEDEEDCNPDFSIYKKDTTTTIANRPVKPTTTTTTIRYEVTSDRIPEASGCTLPPRPEGGNYEIEGCKGNACFKREGDEVKPFTTIKFTCSKLYVLSEKYQRSFCLNDFTWDPPLPTCLKTCRSLSSQSMNLECSYNSAIIPCNKTIVSGTIVKPTCKNAYHIADLTEAFDHTLCLPDGTWEQPLFKCKVYCGKRHYNSAIPAIALGTPVKSGEFPWHAGLFFGGPKGFSRASCGGNVISPYMILTAAHCVYYVSSLQLRPPATVKVGLGKFYSSWNTKEDHEQKFDVKQIIPHQNYQGSIDWHIFDIAVIELTDSIVYSNAVLPVCIDWTNAWPPKNKEVGTVSGWGATVNSTGSNELLMIDLNYMENKDCRSTVSTKFKPYVTIDKFCTKSPKTESGVRQGDSGGGLSFVRDESYFIYGIVSIKPDTSYDEDKDIAGFTSLQYHLTWLRGIEKALNEARRLENQKKGIIIV